MSDSSVLLVQSDVLSLGYTGSITIVSEKRRFQFRIAPFSILERKSGQYSNGFRSERENRGNGHWVVGMAANSSLLQPPEAEARRLA